MPLRPITRRHLLSRIGVLGASSLMRTLAFVTAAPLLAIVLVAARPSYDALSGREVVERLAEVHREDDRIYVYTQGRHAMAFYGGRAGIEEWIQGERHYDDPRGYLREVDALRGSPRAWFFWVNHQRIRFLFRVRAVVDANVKSPSRLRHKRSGARLSGYRDPV